MRKSHLLKDSKNPTIYHYIRCQTALTLHRGSEGVNNREWMDRMCRSEATYEMLSLTEVSYSRSVKEVIQPQVPLRLPCYDFAPVTALAFGRSVHCGFLRGLRALAAPMA